MDLELATIEDIIDELARRQMRFVFVGVEHTNSHRDSLACVAGRGVDEGDVMHLFAAGKQAFEGLDWEPEDFGRHESE